MSTGRSIAVVSGKGGVGKSTIAAAIGMLSARRGLRTVLVDMDLGLRNLDILFEQETVIFDHIVDVCRGRAAFQDAVLPISGFTGLFLLPASPNGDTTAVTEEQIASLTEKLKAEFDLVIFDGPSGAGDGFRKACSGADQILIVLTQENASVRCADRVRSLADAMGRHEITYVINRCSAKAAEGLQTPEDLEDLFGAPALGQIPYSEKLICLPAICEVLGDRGDPVYRACESLVDRLLEPEAEEKTGDGAQAVSGVSKPARRENIFIRALKALRS